MFQSTVPSLTPGNAGNVRWFLSSSLRSRRDAIFKEFRPTLAGGSAPARRASAEKTRTFRQMLEQLTKTRVRDFDCRVRIGEVIFQEIPQRWHSPYSSNQKKVLELEMTIASKISYVFLNCCRLRINNPVALGTRLNPRETNLRGTELKERCTSDDYERKRKKRKKKTLTADKSSQKTMTRAHTANQAASGVYQTRRLPKILATLVTSAVYFPTVRAHSSKFARPSGGESTLRPSRRAFEGVKINILLIYTHGEAKENRSRQKALMLSASRGGSLNRDSKVH